jgi:ribosomal protein L30E
MYIHGSYKTKACTSQQKLKIEKLQIIRKLLETGKYFLGSTCSTKIPKNKKNKKS